MVIVVVVNVVVVAADAVVMVVEKVPEVATSTAVVVDMVVLALVLVPLLLLVVPVAVMVAYWPWLRTEQYKHTASQEVGVGRRGEGRGGGAVPVVTATILRAATSG